jgi:hypothetical protein
MSLNLSLLPIRMELDCDISRLGHIQFTFGHPVLFSESDVDLKIAREFVVAKALATSYSNTNSDLFVLVDWKVKNIYRVSTEIHGLASRP